MKTAIVHEWLVTYAGSERVLEQILRLYPAADLYVVVDFLPESERHILQHRIPRTTFIQILPFARKAFRRYLPLMPYAVERIDLQHYDLVISSSHAVAKGVRTSGIQQHICYCHTPMRYAWDFREEYLQSAGFNQGIRGYFANALLDRLRAWDVRTAGSVDHFIANSRYIADRIQRAYRRDATVIYPPVDTDTFTRVDQKDDYYLAASRMVPYKKMDLIVETFSRFPSRSLKVVGDGPDLERIRAHAGKNIEFLGYQPAGILAGLLQRSKAFVFAAEEDFGILPVEAQACGTPVIAYGKGGVRETVVSLSPAHAVHAENAPTGVLFPEQTTGSLADALTQFEEHAHMFDPAAVRKNAERFGVERFRREFNSFVDKVTRRHPV